MNFFRILGMPNFEAFSLNVHKNWRTWLQMALKKFLEVWCTCSKYLKCPPRLGLSNELTLVTIRRVETKWCKKNEKRRPDAPFEFHFSRYILIPWMVYWSECCGASKVRGMIHRRFRGRDIDTKTRCLNDTRKRFYITILARQFHFLLTSISLVKRFHGLSLVGSL